MKKFDSAVLQERLIYQNRLEKPADMDGFILEGQADINFENNSMRLRNALDNDMGQKANYVLWCPEVFPENVKITWEFKPVTDVGLCILFFAAAGSISSGIQEPDGI
ncbi:DUF1961 family protein [Anaerocolumna sedimenticola]|uniref:DUF1961 family protein n=1 Tax=Anaerocolumna sedimenticola TaxID=2696063 RepID=A0A6P1TH52_9FIRM|nr:DUF1961 family protein [Anaerocolumna sedimenticola]QHQ59422.1 DUF1961 family protein [Anaerocolumna sedimenticola]